MNILNVCPNRVDNIIQINDIETLAFGIRLGKVPMEIKSWLAIFLDL